MIRSRFFRYCASLLLVLGILVSGAARAEGDSAQVKGVIESVLLSKHMVKVSHEAVPQWNWPGMKMKFAVAPEVDLKSIKEGATVEMTLVKGADGKAVITEFK